MNSNIRIKRLPKVKGKMRELGITNRAIAKKADASESMVSKVICGRAKAQYILDAIMREIASRS